MLESIINDISSEIFENTKLGESISKVIEIFSKVQMGVFALSEKRGEEKLTVMKAVTVLMLVVSNKVSQGKLPKDFDEEDWKEVAETVSQYAIFTEDKVYSMFIFELYAQYISISADVYAKKLSDETINAIRKISDEINEKSHLLENGDIEESEYIEDCLWLSLEGMIKLLSATLSASIGEEYSKLAQAVAMFSMEYGRYIIYKERDVLLEKYLENQKQLDVQLQQEYGKYEEEIRSEALKFDKLIENAFASNFRETLHSSVLLAIEAGVSKEEILDSTEQIDEYFG